MPCDVLVIGGGPAGLSAAINLRARNKAVLVVTNPPEENPLWKSEKVDNYPGLPGMTGEELLNALRSHAEASGVEFLTGKVLSAVFSADSWYVSVGSDVQEARALVLAAGVARGKKFPGEEEFLGKGISYCATCDGMLYRKRAVAVLGWTDSAQHEADYLRSIGCLVTYYDRPNPVNQRRGQGGIRTATERPYPWRVCSYCGPALRRMTCSPAWLPKKDINGGSKMATSLPVY